MLRAMTVMRLSSGVYKHAVVVAKFTGAPLVARPNSISNPELHPFRTSYNCFPSLNLHNILPELHLTFSKLPTRLLDSNAVLQRLHHLNDLAHIGSHATCSYHFLINSDLHKEHSCNPMAVAHAGFLLYIPELRLDRVQLRGKLGTQATCLPESPSCSHSHS